MSFAMSGKEPLRPFKIIAAISSAIFLESFNSCEGVDEIWTFLVDA